MNSLYCFRSIVFVAIIILVIGCVSAPLEQRLVQHLKDDYDDFEACRVDLENATATRNKERCDQLMIESIQSLLTHPLAHEADINVLKGVYNEALGIDSEWYVGKDDNILILIEHGSCVRYHIAVSDAYVVEKSTGQTIFTGQIQGNVDFAGVRSTQMGWEMISDWCPGTPAYWYVWHIESCNEQWGIDSFCPAEYFWETASMPEYLVHIPEETLTWSDQEGQVVFTFWLWSKDTLCNKVLDVALDYQMHRQMQIIYQREAEGYIQISKSVLEEEILSSEPGTGGFARCIP